MVQVTPETATWSQILNFANTGLVALVGFLLREAWITIHRRMDEMDRQQGDMRERISSLEAFRGWGLQRRRSDPHNLAEE